MSPINGISTEAELAAFFEMTPDLVCIAGTDGYFKKVNQAVIDKLGYTKQELFAQPIATFIFAEDQTVTQNNRVGLLAGTPLRNFINRYVTKSGQLVWLEWTSVYSPDKEIVFAIAKDVTERKEIELEVEKKFNKFKNLATHLKTRIEKDKKFLAYELHEEIAQLVVVSKLDMEWMDNNSEGLPVAFTKRIEHALTISRLLVKAIQKISFSISPSMIDELGLNAAMEWLCNEFSLLNNVHCSYTHAYKEDSLTSDTPTDFFRICQECLANVAQHANATTVEVSITASGNTVTLLIKDNGKGFDVNQLKDSSGLLSLQERAASINAILTITSQPGSGTTVNCSVEKINKD